jgi:hypothetical protein
MYDEGALMAVPPLTERDKDIIKLFIKKTKADSDISRKN